MNRKLFKNYGGKWKRNIVTSVFLLSLYAVIIAFGMAQLKKEIVYGETLLIACILLSFLLLFAGFSQRCREMRPPQARKKTKEAPPKSWAPDKDAILPGAVALAAVAAHVGIIYLAGYLVAAALLMLALSFYVFQEKPWWQKLLIAAAASLLLYGISTSLMGIVFPQGYLWALG